MVSSGYHSDIIHNYHGDVIMNNMGSHFIL